MSGLKPKTKPTLVSLEYDGLHSAMARLPKFLNTNALWGAVGAKTLQRCGLTHVIISPGSRSTPLAHAFATTLGLHSIVALDERSAAFQALGLSKATGCPTALLCTSGTAAANYLPAVVEARLSGTPLIILTADRPPELRECHSGQTIDQNGIYGNYPVWPPKPPSLRTTSACSAIGARRWSTPGNALKGLLRVRYTSISPSATLWRPRNRKKALRPLPASIWKPLPNSHPTQSSKRPYPLSR